MEILNLAFVIPKFDKISSKRAVKFGITACLFLSSCLVSDFNSALTFSIFFSHCFIKFSELEVCCIEFSSLSLVKINSSTVLL